MASSNGATIRESAVETGGATPPATIVVWDPFVRIFHWSLAALFLLAYVTGDESERVHVAVGYTIVGLMVLRIAWGFLGPPTARFSNFVRPPREVIAYLCNATLLRTRRHLGHNPAGGAMIVALLMMLAGISISGYMMTTDAYWGSQLVEDIHVAFTNVTIALIAIHIFGVLVASFEHRENLVKSMFTGRKRPE